jgi:chromosome segregation ATPase
MSINIKKYTKDQMAKMVEDAQEAAEKMNGCMNELRSRNSELELQVRTLKAKNAALTEQIDQMNGEAINKANEIANLKADADALRNKIADTEAALGRANACIATMQVEKDQQTNELFEWQGTAQALHDDLLNARERANYAEAHPWRNLWAWLKRTLARHD